MSKKFRKARRVMSYIEHLLVLVSTVTGCVSVSAFASLVGIPVRIANSAVGLTNCVIVSGIKKYQSIIKKKKKKVDKTVLLAKSKLNRIGVLIPKAIIDSNIRHDEFLSINNLLKGLNKLSLINLIN